MDGWNTSFLLGWQIFGGYVSFRECVLDDFLQFLWMYTVIDFLHILFFDKEGNLTRDVLLYVHSPLDVFS